MSKEKDNKVRISPEMGVAIDALIPRIQRVPELAVRMSYGGKVRKPGVVRELLSRGLESLERDLKKLLPEEVPVVVKPKAAAKPARKPAKKATKRRR